jgi:type IV pilus assembly protein PilO
MTLQENIEVLQNLDYRAPGTWPRWVHIGAVVLAALLIVGVGIYAFIDPDYETLTRERQNEMQLRQTFEGKQKKVAALDAYRAQLVEMQHSFGDMLKQLPSKGEVANLLNDISETRIASNLEQELFQPMPEAPKDFYAELPNKIIVTGGYHQMGQFVSGVAALPRIVVIDEVEIKPVSAGSGKPADAFKSGALRMTAMAKTYRYLDPSEMAAAAPAKPGTGARK